MKSVNHYFEKILSLFGVTLGWFFVALSWALSSLLPLYFIFWIFTDFGLISAIHVLSNGESEYPDFVEKKYQCVQKNHRLSSIQDVEKKIRYEEKKLYLLNEEKNQKIYEEKIKTRTNNLYPALIDPGEKFMIEFYETPEGKDIKKQMDETDEFLFNQSKDFITERINGLRKEKYDLQNISDHEYCKDIFLAKISRYRETDTGKAMIFFYGDNLTSQEKIIQKNF